MTPANARSAARLTVWENGIAFAFPRPRVGACAERAIDVLVRPVAVVVALGMLTVLYGPTLDSFTTELMRLAAAATIAALLSLAGLLVGKYVIGRLNVRGPGEVRQLRAADGGLFRVRGDGAQQAWPRAEIADLRWEIDTDGDGPYLGLFVRDGRGNREWLYGHLPYSRADADQRAELAWIAAELRHALGLPDGPPADPGLATAVRPADTRIQE